MTGVVILITNIVYPSFNVNVNDRKTADSNVSAVDALTYKKYK
jgi:hypothetical protein